MDIRIVPKGIEILVAGAKGLLVGHALQLQTDAAGWIITDSKLQTSVPGIFAAGDVRDTSLRQVVTAAGDGARAAMAVYAYLQH